MARKPKTQTLRPASHVDDDVFHKSAVTRGPNVPELLLQQHQVEREHRGLADLLDAFCILHEAFGDNVPDKFRSAKNVPIPIEVIEIIQVALLGNLQSANAERTKKARQLQAECAKLVDELGITPHEATRRVVKTPPRLARRWEELQKGLEHDLQILS